MSKLEGKNDGEEKKAPGKGNSYALALLQSPAKLLLNSQFMSTANKKNLRIRKEKQMRNPRKGGVGQEGREGKDEAFFEPQFELQHLFTVFPPRIFSIQNLHVAYYISKKQQENKDLT